MKSKSTIVSYALAALAGVCFVTGITLLTDEGSATKHGVCKEANINA